MRIFSLAFLALALTQPAIAQQGLPEKRPVYQSDTDFYGGDLRSIFDTTLEICERSCLAEAECKALTYNTRSSACFLKTDVETTTPYEGAFSARMVEADREALKTARARLADLDFLSDYMLEQAHRQALMLARRYPRDDWTVEAMNKRLADMENLGSRGGIIGARERLATSLDTADAWVRLARAARSSSNRNTSLSAAINAYLRAETPSMQVTALRWIADAVEARGAGRQAIPALRLALALEPGEETQDALDRVVGLFGFRVSEHRVDNNAANPRICVTFNEDLVEAGVNYGDFVRIDRADLPVVAEKRQLCLEGVEHGARVTFTLREGLPAASGEALHKSSEISVYVRDRDPSVRFVGRSYVLPKSQAASIPVVAVNAEELEVSIHRVADRNLVSALQQGLVGSPLNERGGDRIRARLGEEVWRGFADVSTELNKDVTTDLPIGDALGDFEPGVYAMRASVVGAEDDGGADATQWFIVTDLGLATLKGSDGLHVFVRGLSDAQARDGVTLTLTAANNEVLGTVITNSEGYALFPAGLTRGEFGNVPALLTAGKGDDYAYLDLSDAAFDLSDRGVEGRAAPGPIDVFATTERGVYRPGETVHLTALARDAQAKAIADLPLTAILRRPDGVEFTRQTLERAGAGGGTLSIALPELSQRGTWRLALHADPEAAALTDMSFLVEDFEPERIDFDLSLPEGALDPDASTELLIDARYLYGAPGAGLQIEGDVRVSAATTLEGFEAFQFGLADERFSSLVESFPATPETDADGRAVITLDLPRTEPQARPLNMTATVRLKDGSGRPVERRITRPLKPQIPLIGIRALSQGAVEQGGLARFEVVAVGRDGTQIALENVSWTLSRIERDYQWYRYGGRWNFEPIVTRERVANGVLDLGADEPVSLEAPVDWGEYELKLASTDGGYTASSTKLYAGWYSAGAGSDTPDRLEVSLDKESYAVGDVARLQLLPRDAGQVLVTVATDRLIDMQTLAVKAGETVVDIPVTAEWGPGAYVTATLIQPADTRTGRNPARSIGLGWVEVDPGEARLTAEFTSPRTALPRETMVAELQVTGVAEGETAWVTIAAVDVGILNLTGFEPPDPDGHYFGQRKLGMEIRDLYGRLIDGGQGVVGALRSGGDGGAVGPKSPPPTQDLVAFFSGPLQVGTNGRVTARFDMPDFNGTVKLMAIVWSENGVGQAEQDVLVRDPIVVSASLPRFLAPGDTSRLLVELAHATGPAGDVKVEVLGTSDIIIDSTVQQITLEELARVSLDIPLTANGVSDNELRIFVTTPSGQVLTKDLRLAVRANDPEISRQSRISLAAGDALTLTEDVFAGLSPGSGRVSLAAGPLARFDVPGLLTALDRYPYGCTEQLTSRALPLIYFEQVASNLGLTERAEVRTRVDQAIVEVLSNQTRSGGFGLWRPFGGDLWLDAYVTDFLSRAKAQDYKVPEKAFTAAIDNLRSSINYAGDFERGGQGIAYALLVLSREGAASIGDLRYYADTKTDDFATPLAKGQIGAALAFYGDQVRADRMFRAAMNHIEADRAREEADARLWRADYGSSFRDSAALLTLAVEAGSDAVDRDYLADGIARRLSASRYHSTQEKMWTLLATNALVGDPGQTGLTRNGVAVEGPLVELLDSETLAGGSVIIENTSASSVETVMTTFGVPTEPEPAQGNGYQISRQYFTFEGEPVDLGSVVQNDRLVVVITVRPERTEQARLMVNDPLPAGFEIDNPNLIRAGDVSALDWLDLDEVTEFAEFRTDRFLAAVDWSGKDSFKLGYIVRAISPGSFHHPAASVEDMYRPALRARSDFGQVEIAEAP